MRSVKDRIQFPQEYIEFFELFNQREYFESHEVLEDLWIMETGEEKQYYKGLIMVTIALEHWRRNNPSGAYRLWRDGEKLLEKYPSHYKGFELGTFRKMIADLMKRIIETEGLECDPCKIDQHPILELQHESE